VRFVQFDLERWQSTWENRVRYNLSESGVHPLSIQELLRLAAMTIDERGPGGVAECDRPLERAGQVVRDRRRALGVLRDRIERP